MDEGECEGEGRAAYVKLIIRKWEEGKRACSSNRVTVHPPGDAVDHVLAISGELLIELGDTLDGRLEVNKTLVVLLLALVRLLLWASGNRKR